MNKKIKFAAALFAVTFAAAASARGIATVAFTNHTGDNGKVPENLYVLNSSLSQGKWREGQAPQNNQVLSDNITLKFAATQNAGWMPVRIEYNITVGRKDSQIDTCKVSVFRYFTGMTWEKPQYTLTPGGSNLQCKLDGNNVIISK